MDIAKNITCKVAGREKDNYTIDIVNNDKVYANCCINFATKTVTQDIKEPLLIDLFEVKSGHFDSYVKMFEMCGNSYLKELLPRIEGVWYPKEGETAFYWDIEGNMVTEITYSYRYFTHSNTKASFHLFPTKSLALCTKNFNQLERVQVLHRYLNGLSLNSKKTDTFSIFRSCGEAKFIVVASGVSGPTSNITWLSKESANMFLNSCHAELHTVFMGE